MSSITATELKTNLSKYLALASTEDVLITQYGRVIAKLTNPFQDRIGVAESLFGSLPQTTTLEEALEERINEE
jgi:antitoxin (DNA-binding transcriptional repressor) of toxin-antitoxin stability system